MAKVDEWRKKKDDWKAILSQPKNIGLRSTGISEALLKVGDAEMDYAKAKLPGTDTVGAYNDLSKALGDLITVCKTVSDKHKKVFTEACKAADGFRDAATARRSEAAREVDTIRNAVGDRVGEFLKRMKDAADVNTLATVWHAFVADFESHGKGFPTLKAAIAKVKEHQAPAGVLAQIRPEYLQLAQACQNATKVR